MHFTHLELDDHWNKIEHHTLVRQSWIEELDNMLNAIETDRALLVSTLASLSNIYKDIKATFSLLHEKAETFFSHTEFDICA